VWAYSPTNADIKLVDTLSEKFEVIIQKKWEDFRQKLSVAIAILSNRQEKGSKLNFIFSQLSIAIIEKTSLYDKKNEKISQLENYMKLNWYNCNSSDLYDKFNRIWSIKFFPNSYDVIIRWTSKSKIEWEKTLLVDKKNGKDYFYNNIQSFVVSENWDLSLLARKNNNEWPWVIIENWIELREYSDFSNLLEDKNNDSYFETFRKVKTGNTITENKTYEDFILFYSDDKELVYANDNTHLSSYFCAKNINNSSNTTSNNNQVKTLSDIIDLWNWLTLENRKLFYKDTFISEQTNDFELVYVWGDFILKKNGEWYNIVLNCLGIYCDNKTHFLEASPDFELSSNYFYIFKEGKSISNNIKNLPSGKLILKWNEEIIYWGFTEWKHSYDDIIDIIESEINTSFRTNTFDADKRWEIIEFVSLDKIYGSHVLNSPFIDKEFSDLENRSSRTEEINWIKWTITKNYLWIDNYSLLDKYEFSAYSSYTNIYKVTTYEEDLLKTVLSHIFVN